tara:strand:+ start:6743 stop:7741 length:999 start_codon:yes stop_codon:yes gene_type:complete
MARRSWLLWTVMCAAAPRLLVAARAVHEVFHVERAPGNWLHGVVHGHDEKLPLLLFITGGKGTPFVTFEPSLRPLAQHFVYATYSMRGVMSINNTRPPHGTVGHIADAVWMTEYLAHRFRRKVIVSGLSFGADLAMQVAASVPRIVVRVIAISGFFDIPANYALVKAHMRARVPRPLMWLSELLGSDNVVGYILTLYLAGFYGLISYDCHAAYPCVPSTLVGPSDVLGSELLYDVWFGLKTVFDMHACVRSYADADTVLVAPGTVQVPIEFWVGQHDLMANRRVLDAYLTRLVAPETRIVAFERSTHFVPLEEPAAFHAEMAHVAQACSAYS